MRVAFLGSVLKVHRRTPTTFRGPRFCSKKMCLGGDSPFPFLKEPWFFSRFQPIFFRFRGFTRKKDPWKEWGRYPYNMTFLGIELNASPGHRSCYSAGSSCQRRQGWIMDLFFLRFYVSLFGSAPLFSFSLSILSPRLAVKARTSETLQESEGSTLVATQAVAALAERAASQKPRGSEAIASAIQKADRDMPEECFFWLHCRIKRVRKGCCWEQ